MNKIQSSVLEKDSVLEWQGESQDPELPGYGKHWNLGQDRSWTKSYFQRANIQSQGLTQPACFSSLLFRGAADIPLLLTVPQESE